jgi:hypothetical protein
MSDEVKVISLTVISNDPHEVSVGYGIAQSAATQLFDQNVPHNLNCATVEEGPEPSVWRDSDGVVWVRTPTDQPRYAENAVVAVGFAFTTNGPQMVATETIEDEWEVLY